MTPSVPPPPLSAQNSSGCSSADARTSRVGEAHRLGHVAGVLGHDDHGGTLVDQEIEAGAGGVVAVVAGGENGAADPRAQVGDGEVEGEGDKSE